MIPINAAEMAAALGASSTPELEQATVTGVSIDSRSVEPGDLFIALKGSRVDGRTFVPAALARGAAAAISEKGGLALGRVIEVEDPVAAFWRVAKIVREGFFGPAIAVGGSAGKTTTKEILRAFLAPTRRVVASEKSFNNHLGVPLTICSIEADTEALVAEVGTNHPGEIAPLVELVNPTHAVVTAIGAEHLEGFETLSGVLDEEMDLVRALPHGGVVFINADCEILDRANFPQHVRVIRVGFSRRATDVRGEARRGDDGRLAVRLDPGASWIDTRLTYGVLQTSLLLAAAVARHLGVRDEDLASAARDIGPAPLRGEVKRINGATLLVDCYNSNPLSAAAALKEIGSRGGRRSAVLGDMLELGGQAPELHWDLGREAAKAGLTDVIYIGQFGDDFEKGLAGSARCHVHPSTTAARESFARLVKDGGTILVKASRSVGLERLVAWEEEAHGV
jgi:UDP-N-acetylmuramoyl-tripeptide--D-alanyl-D-alanine ligase